MKREEGQDEVVENQEIKEPTNEKKENLKEDIEKNEKEKEKENEKEEIDHIDELILNLRNKLAKRGLLNLITFIFIKII